MRQKKTLRGCLCLSGSCVLVILILNHLIDKVYKVSLL